MDTAAFAAQLLKILIIMAIGFIARKLKAIDRTTNQSLSAIIMDVGLPCVLFSACMEAGEIDLSTKQILIYFLMGFIWQAVCLFIGWLCACVLAKKGTLRGTYAYGIGLGNLGVFGLPVVKPLLGSSGLVLGAFLTVQFGYMAYTVGIRMLSPNKISAKESLKHFFAPSSFVCIISPLLMILKPNYPAVIVNTVKTLADMTLPLLMLTIGSSLAACRIADIKRCPKVLLAVAFKLLIIPALLVWPTRYIVKDTLMASVMILLSAMPVGGSATSMNILYGEHSEEASLMVLLSTTLSLITIPLIVQLFL